jgi:hypothetical protein
VVNTKVKGLVHAGLALGAVIEAFTTKSKVRRILSGIAAGYHAHATMYHMLFEKETHGKEVKQTHGIRDYEGFEDI